MHPRLNTITPIYSSQESQRSQFKQAKTTKKNIPLPSDCSIYDLLNLEPERFLEAYEENMRCKSEGKLGIDHA